MLAKIYNLVYSDHLSDFHVDNELREFAVEFDKEFVEATDPSLPKFLKNNTFHRSRRSMVVYS